MFLQKISKIESRLILLERRLEEKRAVLTNQNYDGTQMRLDSEVRPDAPPLNLPACSWTATRLDTLSPSSFAPFPKSCRAPEISKLDTSFWEERTEVCEGAGPGNGLLNKARRSKGVILDDCAGECQ